jgi:uncharacterized secreted protein with C-terminal beta-propeller domain
MKNKRMFITALVFAIICGFTVSASESDAIKLAKSDLREKFVQELRAFPIDEVSGLDLCNTVVVYFKVTETNQVEIINVKSANQDLLHYAKERLSQSNVVANGLLQGNSYKISFRFVEARRTW